MLTSGLSWFVATAILGMYAHLPIAWCYCWRSGEPKTQYSNWCVFTTLDRPSALLTRHQPFAAVSFVRPHLEYTLILGVAFFRIAVFYVGGVFVIGLIVPRNADVFVGGSAENKIAASPFVHGKGTPRDTVPVAETRWTAAIQFGANSFVHIVNATLMVFIISAANSQLYIASRTLYGLSLLGQAPKIFRRVNRRGVPMPALAFCSIFACLVFLNASEGPGKGTWLRIKPSHTLTLARSL